MLDPPLPHSCNLNMSPAEACICTQTPDLSDGARDVGATHSEHLANQMKPQLAVSHPRIDWLAEEDIGAKHYMRCTQNLLIYHQSPRSQC